ncbi:hypothetical protein BDZ88DRAFT_434717 [Geranomyces variabilis]|nr:hypothetical protein BDZ88DRAFT_434717 [Geranomyces variabilis]
MFFSLASVRGRARRAPLGDERALVGEFRVLAVAAADADPFLVNAALQQILEIRITKLIPNLMLLTRRARALRHMMFGLIRRTSRRRRRRDGFPRPFRRRRRDTRLGLWRRRNHMRRRPPTPLLHALGLRAIGGLARVLEFPAEGGGVADEEGVAGAGEEGGGWVAGAADGCRGGVCGSCGEEEEDAREHVLQGVVGDLHLFVYEVV